MIRALWPSFPRIASRGAGCVRALTTAAADARSLHKNPDSRKSYLVDQYVHLIRNNPVILVSHHNTLLKTEDASIRGQLKKLGAQLVVTRSNLFKVALRGLEHEDPASKEAHKQFRNKRHPLSQLFTGPTAVIAMSDLDPKKVESIVKILDRTGERLLLLGGQIDGSMVDRAGVDHFKTLPSLEQLRAQLAGVLTVLGGAGLVQTLEASSKMLYLTLDAREKDLKGPEEQESS